jgi:hypothetical protein
MIDNYQLFNCTFSLGSGLGSGLGFGGWGRGWGRGWGSDHCQLYFFVGVRVGVGVGVRHDGGLGLQFRSSLTARIASFTFEHCLVTYTFAPTETSRGARGKLGTALCAIK